MITTDNLPTEYAPYQTLVFCSNKISGGGHIFAMGKVLPLLIGSGETPRVWLQAVASPQGKEFVTIVNDSTATHPAVEVTTLRNKITIAVKGVVVLTVDAISAQHAEVTKVDFRPLGLKVFGDGSGLNVGGMRLGRNTFDSVGIAFSLGA